MNATKGGYSAPRLSYPLIVRGAVRILEKEMSPIFSFERGNRDPSSVPDVRSTVLQKK